MWKTGLLVLYLLILSIYDCREKKVPVMLLYMGAVTVGLFAVIELFAERIAWYQLFGIVPGFFLLVVAIVTQKAGIADGIVLAIVGVVIGIKPAILLFCSSLLLLSFVGVILLFFRKVRMKTRVPYIPFLTVAFVAQQML